jgi:nicotinamidase/pyrazinamidase
MIHRDRSALVLVDVQPDFMPGGALAVGDGDAILTPLLKLLAPIVSRSSSPHRTGIRPVTSRSRAVTRAASPSTTSPSTGTTRDCAPIIASWAVPARRFTRNCLSPSSTPLSAKAPTAKSILTAGFATTGTRLGAAPTGLAGLMGERGITDVYITGLARDVCVKWTAEDAADLGFATSVIWDLTRPVNPASDGRVRAAPTRGGVRIVESRDVI